MKLTQKSFDKLVDGMNHRLTGVEGDIKWIKWIGYYIVGVLTMVALGGFVLI